MFLKGGNFVLPLFPGRIQYLWIYQIYKNKELISNDTNDTNDLI